jgi:hypothetical protein
VRKRRGPCTAQATPDLVIPEVLPAWSPLKRYTDLDPDSYQELVKAARWVFEYMQSSGALSCTLRRCIDSIKTAAPEPPVSSERLRSFFGNRFLQFENIRTAALSNDFTQIQLAYYRNATLLADRAVANPERQKFIAWAVELLRSRRSSVDKMTMSQDELLAAWDAIPDEERVTKKKGRPCVYFKLRDGVKLTMEEIHERAFPMCNTCAQYFTIVELHATF